MYKGVKFAIHNVYPETAFETYTHIHNVGSIPAHWIGATIYLWYWEDVDEDGMVDEDEWMTADAAYFDGMGIDVWVEAKDGAGATIPGICFDPQTLLVTMDPEYQFHPCEGIDLYITYYFTDELPECAAFKGQIVFNFVQWNWQAVPGQPPV
jgi:hypothetical protein